jgi:hypothetical protein
MTAAFTFDEASHAYALDGVRLPSVTQLINGAGIGPDFSMVPRDALEAARAFGVAVHSACELDDLDELDDTGTDARVMGCVEAWRRFKRETEAEILATEQRLYHPTLRYAGTLDGLARLTLKGDARGLWLLDRKTGAEPHPSYGVQLAAYEQLLRGQTGADFAAMGRATVHLDESGRYRFHRFTNHSDAACFMACLALNQWKEANK